MRSVIAVEARWLSLLLTPALLHDTRTPLELPRPRYDVERDCVLVCRKYSFVCAIWNSNNVLKSEFDIFFGSVSRCTVGWTSTLAVAVDRDSNATVSRSSSLVTEKNWCNAIFSLVKKNNIIKMCVGLRLHCCVETCFLCCDRLQRSSTQLLLLPLDHRYRKLWYCFKAQHN